MKIVLICIAVILVALLLTSIYLGGFTKVIFRIEEQGGETLVFKKMTGDYAQAGKVSNEVYYSLLNEYGIETYKGFGIYYDNPKEVERSKLRSDVGCILEEKDREFLPKLENKFEIKTYPKREYIVCEFPFKNKLSIIIALLKVYPAMNKFVEEKGYNAKGSVMEIYDIPNQKIFYRKVIPE